MKQGSLTFGDFLQGSSRFLFFTGKGGVGKTSLASASAVGLASLGRKVLLVSTDPASNLDEVLVQQFASEPRAVNGAPGLFALNINPEEAAKAYKERVVAPLKGKLPTVLLASIEEQLSGACTVEIAAFQEFVQLLTDNDIIGNYDHVVFDTAPTGHTLRLLTLPKAWEEFLDNNQTGSSCLGPLSALTAQRENFSLAFKELCDPRRTTLVLVSRLQKAALKEAERTSTELKAVGMSNQMLFLNGILPPSPLADALSESWHQRSNSATQAYENFLGSYPVIRFPLQPNNPIGVKALRGISDIQVPAHEDQTTESEGYEPGETFHDLAKSLRNNHGLIMLMGKGGVGKTTLSSALAVYLSSLNIDVHLTTTDPAAHISDSLEGRPHLKISRIDPKVEIDHYKKEVMQRNGAVLDDSGRALLEEELRSPCTEEIAVFRAFSRIVAHAQNEVVIIDTAPTGHTLLLLDATESYHREVTKKGSNAPPEVLNLLPRLRNPDLTKIILVTVPEPTPVHEAARLQEDLRRAGIEPYAWIVNQSLSFRTTANPVLKHRQRGELRYLEEVKSASKRFAIVPLMNEEPSNYENLSLLTKESYILRCFSKVR